MAACDKKPRICAPERLRSPPRTWYNECETNHRQRGAFILTLYECYLRVKIHLLPVHLRMRTVRKNYAPILTPAFAQDTDAQLLALFTLEAVEEKKLRTAAKGIIQMKSHCKTDADWVLWCILAGMYYRQNRCPRAMTVKFDEAASLGHPFYLPHMLSGEYYLCGSHQFEKAYAEYDQAIDCIYRCPPLDDFGQQMIARSKACMAYALTMMHRPDEADAMLAKAEFANDSEEYLRASAMLSAVKRDAEAANRAVSELKKCNPSLGDETARQVGLILDGTHIHFFPREVAPSLPADFWTWFRTQEPTFQPLLDKNDPDACGQILADHINTLVPDPEDMMTATIELKDGQPEIVLTACYSRSYAAMIEAIAAACPADIRQRWIITLQP